MTKTSRKAHKADPYQDLRVALLQRGFSIRSFARKHGYNVQTAYDAAAGRRAGKVTARIRRHLKSFALCHPNSKQ